MRKLLSLLLPLIFVIGQYNIVTGVSFADLYLVICLLIYIIIQKKFKISKFDISLIIFLIFIVISHFLNILLNNDLAIFEIITRTLKLYFYLIMGISILPRLVCFKSLIKSYKYFAILATLFLMLQFFIYHTTGLYLNGIIPFIELVNPGYNYEPILLSGKFLRASGFFTEPGYYAQFILPYIVMLLFYSDHENINTNNKLLILIFLLLGVLLSSSGQGIFISIIILFIYFINYIYVNKLLKWSHISFIILSIIVFIIVYSTTNFFSYFIERYKFSPFSSTGIRIFRGVSIFNNLPAHYQLVGIGYGNIGNYVIRNSITTPFDIFSTAEYVSSLTNVLISTGLIGLIVFTSIFFIRFLFSSQLYTKILIIVLIILFISTSIIVSTNSIIYLLIIFYNEKNSDKFLNV